eukprot:gene3136-3969_t
MGGGASKTSKSKSMRARDELIAQHAPSDIPTLSSSQCGVTLGFLVHFCEKVKHAYFKDRETFTTKEVVLKVIKPATQAMRCRYVDLGEPKVPVECISTPVLFISHSWDCPFEELVSLLKTHESYETHPENHKLPIWIEFPFGSQVAYVIILGKKQKAWAGHPPGLKVHAIKEADRAVVSVGRNLSAFKNIWSMYTTFNLLQHKKKIEMLLASNITFDDFSKATENIDLPKCQGGRGNNWQEQQTEKQLLLADIDNLGKGYKKAAQKIKEGLMNTTQSEVERVKELHGEMDLRTAFALTQHGNLLEKTGKLEEAEKAYQQALVIDETLLGPKHVQLTSTLGGYTTFWEAVRVHRRALDIWEQECGEQDVRVIRSLNNFALLLKNAGQQREATAGFERGLDILDNKGLGEELPS